MKISGFTFIKDAITYDYPILEAIQSILPLCDEVIVAVGKSTDATLQLIKSIDNKKIKIIETVWDETQRENGQVLAVETNKAFAAINTDADWAVYIQADEVIHEQYIPAIKKAMLEHCNNRNIDGLLFSYLHFYGSYDYVATASNWYKKEIRIIKNNKKIYSYKDAQGFRKNDNEKLNVAAIDAYIYHYGWIKDPRAMQLKQENFNKYWHNDDWIKANVVAANTFDYASHIKELGLFKGTHPQVMQARIEKINWKFEYDIAFNKKKFKDKLKAVAFKYFGLDFNYKNYKVVKN
jgi:hypothetical protein